MDGVERLPARDLLIATTGRSTEDEYVVADGAFETALLTGMMAVTNPRRGA
ncbi:MAG: hypothetical protein ABEJ92_07650 [Halobacteriales archaeon]